MSLCVILQTNKDIFISSDTATVLCEEGRENVRALNGVNKIHYINGDTLFCSGNMEKVNSYISTVSKKSNISIEQYAEILSNQCKELKSFYEIDLIILRDGVVYQISAYNDFKIIQHRKPNERELGVIVAGYKTSEVFKCASEYLSLQKSVNVKRFFEYIYKTFDSVEVGDTYNVYRNEKGNLYHSGVLTYIEGLLDSDVKNTNLIVGERINISLM